MEFGGGHQVGSCVGCPDQALGGEGKALSVEVQDIVSNGGLEVDRSPLLGGQDGVVGLDTNRVIEQSRDLRKERKVSSAGKASSDHAVLVHDDGLPVGSHAEVGKLRVLQYVLRGRRSGALILLDQGIHGIYGDHAVGGVLLHLLQDLGGESHGVVGFPRAPQPLKARDAGANVSAVDVLVVHGQLLPRVQGEGVASALLGVVVPHERHQLGEAHALAAGGGILGGGGLDRPDGIGGGGGDAVGRRLGLRSLGDARDQQSHYGQSHQQGGQSHRGVLGTAQVVPQGGLGGFFRGGDRCRVQRNEAVRDQIAVHVGQACV